MRSFTNSKKHISFYNLRDRERERERGREREWRESEVIESDENGVNEREG